MPKFAEAIKLAESISTKKEKHAALSGLGNDEQRLIAECYNPFRVFNVKKWKTPAAYAQQDGSYIAFLRLLDDLHHRRLTGNMAREAVSRTLGYYTRDTASILERVILKDLKCGASRETFEQLYPGMGIPRFDIMLAARVDETADVLTPEILTKKYGITFPVIAESKYDGNRLIAFVSNGKVEYFSRSGKDSDHVIGLFDDELCQMEATIGQPIVVDGEVLASSFQQTMNAKGSKNLEAKSYLKFFAFDYMTRVEWDAMSNPFPQHMRSLLLENLLTQLGTTKVVKSKYKICNSIKELRDFYAEVLTEGQNPDGSLNGLGEGLIIKNYTGLYDWSFNKEKGKPKRSNSWLKWKPVIDLDLTIVGFEYGTPGTRLEKTVGRILLEGEDENGRKITARCGSGLDDKVRADMLKNWNKYMGKVAMIEAQELTMASGSDTWSARFPIYCKLRTDK